MGFTNSVRIQRMDLDEIKNMIEMENLKMIPLVLTLDKPIDQNLVKHLVKIMGMHFNGLHLQQLF